MGERLSNFTRIEKDRNDHAMKVKIMQRDGDAIKANMKKVEEDYQMEDEACKRLEELEIEKRECETRYTLLD